MSDIIDISVGLTEEKVEINATPNVIEVNIITGSTINPSSYDLADFTNVSANPFVQYNALSAYVPTTRTLTINGTTQDLSADRTFTISTGITIGTTAITSGVVGRVLFEGTGNVVSESANITYDNTNLIFTLGSTATRIFTFRPQDTTGAYGNSCSIRGGISNGRLDFYSASNITELKDNIVILTSVGGPSIQVGASSISLNVASATRLQVAPTTGNVLINTTTDAGFKLDVNGTARVSGQLTCSGSLSVSASGIQVASGGNGVKWGSNVFAISSVNGVLKFSDGADTDFNRLQFGGITSAFPSIKRASNNIEIKNADDTFGAGLSVGASLVASAILQSDSTTKGFLPPRMTTTQKNAIATPATGLMVYDTTLNRPCFYDGTSWISL